MKTPEEIKAEASIASSDTAKGLDTQHERYSYEFGYKDGFKSSQSSIEEEVERRVEEKLCIYKKQIADMLSRLDHSGRTESIIGVLRVEYVPWRTILHEFEKLGVKFEHPF